MGQKVIIGIGCIRYGGVYSWIGFESRSRLGLIDFGIAL